MIYAIYINYFMFRQILKMTDSDREKRFFKNRFPGFEMSITLLDEQKKVAEISILKFVSVFLYKKIV